MATSSCSDFSEFPFAARRNLIPWLEPGDPFPPVSQALDDPDGLLAAGAELTPVRIIQAYRAGIFPWFNENQPVLWWSPNPRMVLFTNELRISHSLRKKVARLAVRPIEEFEVRCDSAFERVMRACAAPRAGQEGTWISQAMVEAYLGLHRLGFAHSVEIWIESQLVGGLYGLAIGNMFYGESMFSEVSDGSKIALFELVRLLHEHGIPMIDCQQQTAHLASLGARPISRESFVDRVCSLVEGPGITAWPKKLPEERPETHNRIRTA